MVKSSLKNKKISKKQVAASRSKVKKPRTLKQSGYRSFRLSKRIKHPGPALPNVWQITKLAIRQMWRHKKLFGAVTAIYLLCTLIFIRGFVITGDLSTARDAVAELFGGSAGALVGSVAVLGLLFESSTPASQAAVTYQTILILLFSLMTIWALRQTSAGVKIGFRDVLYRSSYPLIPFLLVLVVIGLQLVPLGVANFLYNATIVSGFSTTGIEVTLWTLLTFLLALWSLYMVSSSVFAAYIVTLPEMTPVKALKSARGLVQYRRWTVMRKVLFLPVILLIANFVIILPIILIFTPIAEIVFLILGAFMLLFFHSYIYALYKELLA